MPIQDELRTSTRLGSQNPRSGALLAAALLAAATASADAQDRLRERLGGLPFKIAYETYINDNWEIFAMNADGSNPVNLTKTAKEHEHYPQVPTDGTKVCFVADEGEGRDTVRSLFVMDVDGRNRKRLVDHVHHKETARSEEHTSELQSRLHLVCRLLLEKKKN